MTIKEKTIQELESLENEDLRIVYDIIKSLKRKTRIRRGAGNAYLTVRKALKDISGSLSEDILKDRIDRE